MTVGAVDPEQRRLVERLVTAALRRFHRREPMTVDLRIDALVRQVRADAEKRRPSSHRGGARLELPDADLRRVIDDMAAAGRIARSGRRVRLPGAEPGLEPEMAGRVEQLLAGLRAAAAEPPRVEAVAARLGIPPPVLDQLRRSGRLRHVGPGIDYPDDVWSAIQDRVEGMRGERSVGRLRDELGTSRRHAEGILRALARPERRGRGPRSRTRRGRTS